MRTSMRSCIVFLVMLFLRGTLQMVFAQSAANSGTISGIITDPSGAVVSGATVMIDNPVSQYARTARTDAAGHYQFPNVPFIPIISRLHWLDLPLPSRTLTYAQSCPSTSALD